MSRKWANGLYSGRQLALLKPLGPDRNRVLTTEAVFSTASLFISTHFLPNQLLESECVFNEPLPRFC